MDITRGTPAYSRDVYRNTYKLVYPVYLEQVGINVYTFAHIYPRSVT